jgi:hypothetical protein
MATAAGSMLVFGLLEVDKQLRFIIRQPREGDLRE